MSPRARIVAGFLSLIGLSVWWTGSAWPLWAILLTNLVVDAVEGP